MVFLSSTAAVFPTATSRTASITRQREKPRAIICICICICIPTCVSITKHNQNYHHKYYTITNIMFRPPLLIFLLKTSKKLSTPPPWQVGLPSNANITIHQRDWAKLGNLGLCSAFCIVIKFVSWIYCLCLLIHLSIVGCHKSTYYNPHFDLHLMMLLQEM